MKIRLLTPSAVTLCLLLLTVSFAQEQPGKGTSGNGNATPAALTASTSPEELARAAFAAQGGEKFRQVQSMILRGSVDLFAPNSTQSN